MKPIYLLTMMMICQFNGQPVFAHHELDDHQTSHKKVSKAKHDDVDPWHLLDFAMSPAYAFSSNVRIYFEGNYRIIDSNGIPNHSTGQFPNPENPNTISEQSYQFRMLKDPVTSGSLTRLAMEPFGVAVNGIPFDPAANEFWNRDRNSGWQYEPMFHHSLGLDHSNAHVQPNGAYHYHGLPTGLLERLAQAPKPVLIGYAADGFPIYAPFGYREAKNNRSPMFKLRSSYRLKNGSRPSGPGGRYDGTFVQDYEYVANAGDLDECNGRYGVTSEYPKGIYHYIITDTFPFIPRMWQGTPDPTFLRHGHTGPGGGRNGMRPGGGGGEGGAGNGFPPRDGRFPPGGRPGDGRFPPGGGPGDGRFPPDGGPRGGGRRGGGPPEDGRFPPDGGPPDGRRGAGGQRGNGPPDGGPPDGRRGGGGAPDGGPPNDGPRAGGPPDGGPPNGGPPNGGPPNGGPPDSGPPGGGPPHGGAPGGSPDSSGGADNGFNRDGSRNPVYRPRRLPPDIRTSDPPQ